VVYIFACVVCDGVTEMYCDNGHCVPLSYICDGDNDCTDSSDERYCPAVSTTPGHRHVILFIQLYRNFAYTA